MALTRRQAASGYLVRPTVPVAPRAESGCYAREMRCRRRAPPVRVFCQLLRSCAESKYRSRAFGGIHDPCCSHGGVSGRTDPRAKSAAGVVEASSWRTDNKSLAPRIAGAISFHSWTRQLLTSAARSSRLGCFQPTNKTKAPIPLRSLKPAAVRDRSKGAPSKVPKAIEAVILLPIKIRNPHPLVKAAPGWHARRRRGLSQAPVSVEGIR